MIILRPFKNQSQIC